jgi:hypothetical protein
VLINDKPILADVENVIILKNILNKIYESIWLCNSIPKRQI